MTFKTRNLSFDIAGWITFYCLIWVCWSVGAPIVADAARERAAMHATCPSPFVVHGVGEDLQTFTEVRDLCAS